MAEFAFAPTGEAPPSDRFGRRLVLARRLVLSSVALSQPVCVLAAVSAATQPWRDTDAPAPVAASASYPFDIALAGAGVLSSVALAFLLLRIVRSRIDRPETTLDRDVALSAVVLAGTVCPLAGNNWTYVIPIFWAAGVCLTGSRRRKVGYVLVMLLAAVAPLPVIGAPANGTSGAILFTVTMTAAALAVLAMIWAGYASVIVLWDIITEATAAREAQARLAVSEERLRFSRDMHDLLGHSLSGMAVKSELASRLVERDPGRAAQEMAAVHGLARDALREVRSAVSGYRQVDLDGELASVRAVLSAAGVRCEVNGPSSGIPTQQRTLAAWLVREAATNVLRHSSATRCTITLRRTDRALVVEVHNDGARGVPTGQVRFGNGLTGLAERAVAVGGAVTASASGTNGFLVRAVLPVADAADVADGTTGTDAHSGGDPTAATPHDPEVAR